MINASGYAAIAPLRPRSTASRVTTFGIVHSRFDELWARKMCTWMGVGNDPRYTPTTTFQTFPFTSGLTPNIPVSDYANDLHAQAIAESARCLVELRENWFNLDEFASKQDWTAAISDLEVPRDFFCFVFRMTGERSTSL